MKHQTFCQMQKTSKFYDKTSNDLLNDAASRFKSLRNTSKSWRTKTIPSPSKSIPNFITSRDKTYLFVSRWSILDDTFFAVAVVWKRAQNISLKQTDKPDLVFVILNQSFGVLKKFLERRYKRL